MAGLFISFEGGEGAGKTTQAGLLHQRLQESEIPCALVREPGGTELGEYLREYLKSERPLAPEAELLLFEAARVELVTGRIRPALAAGHTVIADRFADSTIAYQGYGRGLDLGAIASLNGFATGGLRPDITFLLDVTPQVGLGRTIGIQMGFDLDRGGDLVSLPRTKEGRRFEEMDWAFHERVRQGFHRQAEADPDRWITLDGELPVEVVRREIWGRVQERLGLSAGAGTG